MLRAGRYPQTYGVAGCQAYDATMPGEGCADSSGTPMPNAPAWCAEYWCYIDADYCSLDNGVVASTFFPGAYYSTATCAEAGGEANRDSFGSGCTTAACLSDVINHYLVTIAANVEQAWRTTSQCTVADGGAPTAFETEATCIADGTCNNSGSSNAEDGDCQDSIATERCPEYASYGWCDPSGDMYSTMLGICQSTCGFCAAACASLFSDADGTVPAVWTPTNTWTDETVCEWSSTCGCSTCESFTPWASVGDVDLKST